MILSIAVTFERSVASAEITKQTTVQIDPRRGVISSTYHLFPAEFLFVAEILRSAKDHVDQFGKRSPESIGTIRTTRS